MLSTEVLSLLDESSGSGGMSDAAPEDPNLGRSRLLAAFAATPTGRLHKLEAHQIARGVAPNAKLVAALYKHDPPLLEAEGDMRVITAAGRAWLAEKPVPAAIEPG